MYKKIFVSFILMLAILASLYTWKTKTSKPIIMSDKKPSVTTKTFDDKVFIYQAGDLKKDCDLNSEMACAVEFAVKCTLNPDFDGCRDSKLPKFIFMSDEALQRPSEMSFKITKIKPINSDLVEIHTDSTCNGNWFGLCQGRIIYVLVPSSESWRVKDIYAIEI
ncbi:MAG: hypothetical protein IJ870_01490 [Alphaproteobacteria bacterium]|nr:hypothetical protein [Alphaproteobacteria bacterium]